MHSRLGADEAKRREALRAAEAEAKAAGKGIWAEGGESVSWRRTSSPRQERLMPITLDCQQRTVSFQMPTDSQAFINEYKGRDIDGGTISNVSCTPPRRCLRMLFLVAIVEQVRDGSAIRVRLLLENGLHQFVNLVRLPRLFRSTVGSPNTPAYRLWLASNHQRHSAAEMANRMLRPRSGERRLNSSPRADYSSERSRFNCCLLRFHWGHYRLPTPARPVRAAFPPLRA
jgi:hypothetical protein